MDLAIKLTPVEYYIYYRVSTSGQATDSTHGLDIQTQGCEEYAKSNFKIKEHQINYYCDIGSSYKSKCVLYQLNKMLKNLVPRSVIMIWDISRLGRDTIQVFDVLKKIKAKHCVIISIKDFLSFGLRANEDKLFYHKVIGAEVESDLKSIRSKELVRKNREKKIHMGTIPFGFKLNHNKKLIISSEEQTTIKTLIAKYNELKSYSKVADLYNKTKMLYRGKIWTGRRIGYLITKYYKTDNLVKQIHNCNLNI